MAAMVTMVAGMVFSLTTPALADNLPEIQRLIKQGQYAQAMEKVDAYLGSRPTDPQGRFLKGVIYSETNRPNEAIVLFTQLSEDYPELPEPYNNLAVLYAQQRQYDKARAALETAIRTHPSYTVAYENLGDVYAKLASQAYDKALQLDNANAATQSKLALIHDLISISGKRSVKPVALASAADPQTKPAPPAEVKPADEPAPPPAKAKTNLAADDVNRAILAWARAWERKNMKAYFGAYASNFRPPKNMSRKAWEAERTQRIAGKSGKITVQIRDLQITGNGDTATAQFRQHYKASGLSSSATKTMTLVRSGNQWLIKEESVN
ncbi:MAG: tetratricopeptide repeat protein [Zoogloeaceae bacterium]|nr:tetratricopeptide repeat protein [Zoogloeaceae bacterium]